MSILAMVSFKGGVGKSTVAIHLAAEWHRQGLQVLLADCDPQGSVSTWADRAEELEQPAPPVVALGDSLGKQVRELAPNYDVVILDTPGHQSRRTGAALAVADLALVPVMAGTTDVWSVNRTLDAVADANEVREAAGIRPCPAVLLPNGVKRSMLATMTRGSLDGLGLPVVERGLGHRMAFGQALSEGKGITTFQPGSVATLELRELAAELAALMELTADDLEVRHAV